MARLAFVCMAVLTAAWFVDSVEASERSPFHLKWKMDDFTEVKKLEFTILVDELLIQRVSVNRCNCQYATSLRGAIELKVNDAIADLGGIMSGRTMKHFPQNYDPNEAMPLKGRFGEIINVYVANSCNILLVQTSTDRGAWTHRFEVR